MNIYQTNKAVYGTSNYVDLISSGLSVVGLTKLGMQAFALGTVGFSGVSIFSTVLWTTVVGT